MSTAPANFSLSPNGPRGSGGDSTQDAPTPACLVFIETMRYISQQKILQSLVSEDGSEDDAEDPLANSPCIQLAETRSDSGIDLSAADTEAGSKCGANDNHDDGDDAFSLLPVSGVDLSECAGEGYMGSLRRFLLLENTLKYAAKMKQTYRAMEKEAENCEVAETEFARKFPNLALDASFSHRLMSADEMRVDSDAVSAAVDASSQEDASDTEETEIQVQIITRLSPSDDDDLKQSSKFQSESCTQIFSAHKSMKHSFLTGDRKSPKRSAETTPATSAKIACID